MTQRPFLPPSHDNVVNARGVMMSSALNKVMSVQEQSYDDFLNSFTYLSKDDVQAQASNVSDSAYSDLPSRHNIKPSEGTSPGRSNESTSCNKNNSYKEEKSNKENISTCTQSDDLEEEILEEGTKTSIMSTTDSSICAASKLKFDNFVSMDNEEAILDSDDEGSPTDDEFDCGGYVASFGGGSVKSPQENIVGKGRNSIEPETVYYGEEKAKKDNSEEVPEIDIRVVDTYPGEIAENIDESRIEHIQNDRHLDFSAKHGTSYGYSNTESSTEGLNCETCTDEVEPFSLDENFDYDNVVLTPKFTANEMEFLQSLMEQNKISEDEET